MFRFALDGLIKSRKNYNNELFFQGAVINSDEELFRPSMISPREELKKEL